MANKEFRRPDEAAMRRVLNAYKGRIEEIALRFAWTMGLSIHEMLDLTWSNVSFETGDVHLADRNVPMDEEMQQCLQARFDQPVFKNCEFIMISDARQKHMNRVNITNYVRAALDTEEELRDITITNLREDYVIRLLEQHDWPYVLRVAGLSTRSLYQSYGQYNRKNNHRKRGVDAKETAFTQEDEYKYWMMVQEEGASVVGITLWLVWQLGFSLTEVCSLTWSQTDLDAGMIYMNDRQVPMGSTLQKWLLEVFDSRRPDDDSHVVLSPKARRPYREDRLSVVIGEALARKDLLDYDLTTLGQVKKQQRVREIVLSLLKEKGSFTKEDLDKYVEQSDSDYITRSQLLFLIKTGELIRIGIRYYSAREVAPRKMLEAAILEYVKKLDGKGVRLSEIAVHLGIEVRQCSWILTGLVKEGELQRVQQKYYLPDSILAEYQEC